MAEQLPGARAYLLAQVVLRAADIEVRLDCAQVARAPGRRLQPRGAFVGDARAGERRARQDQQLCRLCRLSIGGSAGINADFIDLAPDAGLLVHGYTFNKTGSMAADEFAKFSGWGLDGMFSSHSDLAITARDAFVTAQISEPGT